MWISSSLSTSFEYGENVDLPTYKTHMKCCSLLVSFSWTHASVHTHTCMHASVQKDYPILQ